MKKIIVNEQFDGQRIEKFLSVEFPGRTKNQWKYYITLGKITNSQNKKIKWGERVFFNEVIFVYEVPIPNNEWLPAFSNVEILKVNLESEHWVILEKPAQVPTLPVSPEDMPTLAGSFRSLMPQIVEKSFPPREAGFVNRLDNDTAGLVIVAKDNKTKEKFRQYFANHHIEKTYWAIVRGVFPERIWSYGHIISLSGSKSKVKYVEGDSDKGQRAISVMSNIAVTKNFSLVKILTRYGRRHQVRVQMYSLGFPLVGDKTYGGEEISDFSGHFLWAKTIAFTDPYSKQTITASSRFLNEDRLEFAKKVGFKNEFEEILTF